MVRVDDGVIRLKASLKDGGLLEISEYIVVREGRITRVAYSYHWQDRNGNLKMRWDNVAHHREISTFPHHIHLGSEENVIPSDAPELARILTEIEEKLGRG
ncbi:hypothetical protein HYR99_14030 [Candidatus Poribacteria bacterium]|nr:hypothetical protein [Candidatus Poribacteria bacterium]